MRTWIRPVNPYKFQFKRGDIIAVRKDDFIHGLIAWFQRGKGQPPSRVTHCGIVTTGGSYFQTVIVESWLRVLCWKLARAYPFGWRGRVYVLRPLDVTDESLNQIANRALDHAGSWYGFRLLIFYALDKLIEKFRNEPSFWFRSRIERGRYGELCSSMVNVAGNVFKEHGLDFDQQSRRYVTPSELFRFCEYNADKYDIYELCLKGEHE